MKEATKEFLAEQEKIYIKRREEILNTKDELEIKGTTYYVSNDGDDNNDGLTPETAWKTPNKINKVWLNPGDGVLFKRGDLFRGQAILSQAGITYGAYGEGEKPKFYGWDEDLADPSLWEEHDNEKHIWKYKKEILDVGTLVFNDGEKVSRKLIPTFRGMQFVCRDDETKPFVMENEMTEDLDIFWYFERTLTRRRPKDNEDFPVPEPRNQSGDLYLRCDNGNPGEVFDSIEAIAHLTTFKCADKANVRVDNICMKYYCFGVSAGRGEGAKNLAVTNCEIGWIGGNILHYLGTDPNYPEGRRGSVTRYGNGIEVYGRCDGFLVENNYIYEAYDAGASHQETAIAKDDMKNVTYKNNLIEKCVYGIEYFLGEIGEGYDCIMGNIEICDNIIRLSGYGWGQQRHNVHTPALIKGWSYRNKAKNFKIYGNTLDRCAYKMVHLVAEKEEYCPIMDGNTYIQYSGQMIGRWGGNEVKEPDIEIFDEKAEEKINNVFGDRNAEVYIIK